MTILNKWIPYLSYLHEFCSQPPHPISLQPERIRPDFRLAIGRSAAVGKPGLRAAALVALPAVLADLVVEKRRVVVERHVALVAEVLSDDEFHPAECSHWRRRRWHRCEGAAGAANAVLDGSRAADVRVDNAGDCHQPVTTSRRFLHVLVRQSGVRVQASGGGSCDRQLVRLQGCNWLPVGTVLTPWTPLWVVIMQATLQWWNQSIVKYWRDRYLIIHSNTTIWSLNIPTNFQILDSTFEYLSSFSIKYLPVTCLRT